MALRACRGSLGTGGITSLGVGGFGGVGCAKTVTGNIATDMIANPATKRPIDNIVLFLCSIDITNLSGRNYLTCHGNIKVFSKYYISTYDSLVNSII
jgi:hypothetical protein